MNSKQAEIVSNLLKGVVADDSPFWNDEADLDVDKLTTQFSTGLEKIYRNKLHSNFLGEYSKKIQNGLIASGIFGDDDTEFVEQIKAAKVDEIPSKLAEFWKDKEQKLKQIVPDQSKAAEQIEQVKKSLEAQYQKKLNELTGELGTYKAKEYEAKETELIMSAIPEGVKLNPKQLNALKREIKSEVDIKFTETGAHLFHTGTEDAYGLKNAKKTLIEITELVPATLKDLGFLTDTPKPIKKDFSRQNGNGGNGGGNNGNDDKNLTPTQMRLKAAQELAEN